MAYNPYQAIETGEPGRIGWRIHYFAELDSTQEKAVALAEQGEAQGTVVIAEQQSSGRGRLGRRWYSPPGLNLYLTIVLRPRMPAEALGRLSLVAGVAVAEALETVAQGLVAIKWPNDLWLCGKKVGGVIAETIADSGQSISCVLLGIGLNVNLAETDLPVELRGRATSVRIATGCRCDRIALAAALFSRLDSRYMEAESSGFAPIRPVWERYSALMGRRVTVICGAERLSGVVRGIDPDGALLVEGEAGVARILGGDVSIQGAYD